MYTIERPLFGSVVTISIDADPIVAEAAAEAAYREGQRLQRIFSFYDSDSELTRLNSKRLMKVSKELMDAIRLAMEYCRRSDGQYDIGLGKVFMCRKSGETEPILSRQYENILIKDHTIELKGKDCLIDLGSIAKGLIVDMMADALIEQGVESGIVDGRGDMRLIGEHTVSIQHPRQHDAVLGELLLKDKAVATSGDYRQFSGSFRKSHIINKKDVISATVIADKCMDADLFATLISVKTEPGSLPAGIAAMTVDNNLNRRCYNDFEVYLR